MNIKQEKENNKPTLKRTFETIKECQKDHTQDQVTIQVKELSTRLQKLEAVVQDIIDDLDSMVDLEDETDTEEWSDHE